MRDSLPEPFSPSRRLGIGRELGDSPRNTSKVSRMGWSLKVARVLNLVRRCTLLKLYRLCEHPSALGGCAETDVLGVDVLNSGPLPYSADLEVWARQRLLPVRQYPATTSNLNTIGNDRSKTLRARRHDYGFRCQTLGGP